MSARAVLSRVVPFLLPPAAGAVCWVVSGLRLGPPPGAAAVAGKESAVAERVSGRAQPREAVALRRLAQRIAAADGIAALAALWWETQGAFDEELCRQWLCRLIFDRMLDADAAAAWTWVRTFPKSGAPPHPEADFLTAWGARDAEAAAAAVLARQGAGKGDFYSIALAGAKADPVEFLTRQIYAPWITNTGQLQALRMEALRALAEKDVNKALELAPRFCREGGSEAGPVLSQLGDKMIAERGVRGALLWAKEYKDWPDALRAGLQASLLQELAVEDPAAAGREFFDICKDAPEEAGVFIARAWARRDPPAAIEFAVRMSGDPFSNTGAAGLRAIAEELGPDLPVLLKAIAGLPSGEPGTNWKPLLMEVMRNDPGKTLADLASAKPFAHQADLVNAAVEGWMDSNPLAAFHALGSLPESFASSAKERFSESFGRMAHTGLSSAECMELLSALGGDPAFGDTLRGESLGTVSLLRKIIPEDPASVLSLLSTGATPDKGYSDRTWEHVFFEWSELDPAAVAHQITGAEGNVPPWMVVPAVEGLLRSWMRMDPMAASAWVEGLSEAGMRDAAAEKLAGFLKSSDVPAALAWALSIGDAEGRSRAQDDILTQISFYGPDRAREGVDSAEIPIEAKAECLRILDEKLKLRETDK